MLRPTTAAEADALLAVAVSTGLFDADGARQLLGHVLAEVHEGRSDPGHATLAWSESAVSAPEGWAYFAPDPFQDRVWNLWWIGVRPASHGRRLGRSLLDGAEAKVASEGGRLLVIETSALAPSARAREFYRRSGYTECGRIPDFYAEGDAKVIFCKRLLPSASGDRS